MKSQGHPGSQLQLLKYGPVIRHSAMSPPPVWEQPGILDLAELRVNRHQGGSDPGNGCDQPITRAEPLEEQLLDWISDFKPDDEPCTRELVDGLRCSSQGPIALAASLLSARGDSIRGRAASREACDRVQLDRVRSDAALAVQEVKEPQTRHRRPRSRAVLGVVVGTWIAACSQERNAGVLHQQPRRASRADGAAKRRQL